MKTLKELNASCVLICKFEKTAFLVCEGEPALRYDRPSKCLLFYDNFGTYYVYSYILEPSIVAYSSYVAARTEFYRFIGLINSK